MNRKFFSIAVVLLGLALAFFWPRGGKRASGVLPNDVYIWQRAWTESVKISIVEHGHRFGELVALNAEVSWAKGEPHVVNVPLDYAALRGTGRRIGLALRIGSFAGPFRAGDSKTVWLTELAASLLAQAATNQLAVAELQIDFDCAESKLDGYRVWVEAIRRQVAPVPVTITTLPSWLKRGAFQRLIGATDGFVLQVHSLERPKGAGAPFTLCDPEAARRAVEKAAQVGKPFRVALPTYGYTIAFDRAGRFTGISAEGPALSWPEGVQVREVRTDPEAMTGLVQGWTRDRPESLQGVIWYRLPVAGDRLNWSWPTLAAVMDGKIPRPGLRAEARHSKPGLVEVDLWNSGEASHVAPVQVTLQWSEARLVACDGLQGFESAEAGNNAVQFKFHKSVAPFEPGERRTIGWLRLNKEAEVQIEMASQSN